MKQLFGMPVFGALLLTACVTINVYFPAAEAKEAAREFVEKVIDEADKVEIKDSSKDGGGMAALRQRVDFDPWMLLGIEAPAGRKRVELYASNSPELWAGAIALATAGR